MKVIFKGVKIAFLVCSLAFVALSDKFFGSDGKEPAPVSGLKEIMSSNIAYADGSPGPGDSDSDGSPSPGTPSDDGDSDDS